MDNLTFSKIKEAIEKYTNIAVVTRNNPNVDEMGAALSLYLSLRDLGKNVTISSPSQPLVEVSSLVGIDQVKTTLGGEGGDLVVSFPYKEGEIEKVSYTRDDNFLNIVVKAGEKGLGFKETDVKFTRGGSAPELLFVVGSPRVSDLGKLFDTELLKDTIVVNIDNKAENQGYGDILMVSQRLSSICEAVANLIFSLGFKMDLDIAQNLMLGIATSTENFQSDSTSPLAFEMAGILLRQGALRPSTNSQRRKLITSFDDDMQQNIQPITRKPLQEERPQEKPQPVPQTVKPNNNPPEDWLEPKIYKGSTSF